VSISTRSDSQGLVYSGCGIPPRRPASPSNERSRPFYASDSIEQFIEKEIFPAANEIVSLFFIVGSFVSHWQPILQRFRLQCLSGGRSIASITRAYDCEFTAS